MNNTTIFPEGKLRPSRKAFYEDEFQTVFPVTYTPVKAGVFNVYLFGPIFESTQFIAAIEALQAAGSDDTVVIHLSSPGGSLDATDTFLQAMNDCDGRVIVRATGGCHSAGSVILLHADEFTLSENFNCLIHNGACGAGGDFNKFVAQAKHSIDYMNKIMRKTYEGFLSPDEIEALVEGKDFWLDAAEFMRRWEARQEYFRGAVEEAQNARLLALQEQINAAAAQVPKKRKSKSRAKAEAE